MDNRITRTNSHTVVVLDGYHIQEPTTDDVRQLLDNMTEDELREVGYCPTAKLGDRKSITNGQAVEVDETNPQHPTTSEGDSSRDNIIEACAQKAYDYTTNLRPGEHPRPHFLRDYIVRMMAKEGGQQPVKPAAAPYGAPERCGSCGGIDGHRFGCRHIPVVDEQPATDAPERVWCWPTTSEITGNPIWSSGRWMSRDTGTSVQPEYIRADVADRMVREALEGAADLVCAAITEAPPPGGESGMVLVSLGGYSWGTWNARVIKRVKDRIRAAVLGES